MTPVVHSLTTRRPKPRTILGLMSLTIAMVMCVTLYATTHAADIVQGQVKLLFEADTYQHVRGVSKMSNAHDSKPSLPTSVDVSEQDVGRSSKSIDSFIGAQRPADDANNAIEIHQSMTLPPPVFTQRPIPRRLLYVEGCFGGLSNCRSSFATSIKHAIWARATLVVDVCPLASSLHQYDHEGQCVSCQKAESIWQYWDKAEIQRIWPVCEITEVQHFIDTWTDIEYPVQIAELPSCLSHFLGGIKTTDTDEMVRIALHLKHELENTIEGPMKAETHEVRLLDLFDAYGTVKVLAQDMFYSNTSQIDCDASLRDLSIVALTPVAPAIRAEAIAFIESNLTRPFLAIHSRYLEGKCDFVTEDQKLACFRNSTMLVDLVRSLHLPFKSVFLATDRQVPGLENELYESLGAIVYTGPLVTAPEEGLAGLTEWQIAVLADYYVGSVYSTYSRLAASYRNQLNRARRQSSLKTYTLLGHEMSMTS